MEKINFELFEKVNVARHVKDRNFDISFSKKGFNFNITSAFSRKILESIGNFERVDLYRMGNTYALKPNSVGVIHVRRNAQGGFRVNSASLWRGTLPHSSDKIYYRAWIEQGIVFFKECDEKGNFIEVK